MKRTSRFEFKNFLLISMILLLGGSVANCQNENSQIDISEALLPTPQKVEYKEGIIISPEKFKTIYLYSEADEKDRFTANLLKDEINKLFNYSPDLKIIKSYKKLSYPAVILGIPSDDQEFSVFCSGIPSPKIDNGESYVMEINKKSVIISGGSKAGLFYGVQSLIQLMEEAKWEDNSLQGMLINDWPEMNFRWVHYNYFYHLDRYEYIKESIKKLAKFKINGIVFEFEDKFKYESHPFVAAPNSLTSEQVKELTNLAHKYHIDLIPLVQGFGHAGYLLKHDELKHLRENPEIYQSFCPLKEETYDFIFDLFRETIEATPGVKYFHVGADEVRVMGQCPLCKKEKEKIGELGLYLTWLNRVHEFMKKNGRTIVFWDDMPLKQAGIYKLTHTEAEEKFDSVWISGTKKLENIINKFPQDAIFMRWNYSLARNEGNISTLDWYNKNNFKTMIATAIIGNWPLIPDYNWTPANIKSFVTLGAEKNILGELCTAWGDDAGNHFEIYWLGFLASSEYAWSSENPATLDQYWEKYVRRFFGPNTTGLIPAFQNLSNRVEFWNTALMKKGMKNRRGYQLVTLPELNNKPEEGSWVKHFETIVETAKTEKIKCTEALNTLEKNINKVNNNAYNLEVFASMGRLMKVHCELVLSLGEIATYCDNAIKAREDGRKEEVENNLNKMASVAESAWNEYRACYENLKDVWEIARYPKGGEGYILNTQTNYLAGWTADLSYLILAEKQLDFPKYAEKLRQIAEQYR